MDSLLSAITSASPDRAAQENLKEHLLRNEKVIVRSLADVDAALAALAPARCGMSALILLGCQAENVTKYEFQAELFFMYARRALLEAPRLHIELASSKAVDVCRRLATLARTNGNAGCTAGLIRHVLNVLSPTTHTLSPLHAMFFQTVLAGKQLSLARAVLDRPVFDVRPKESPVTVEDVLLYFYYGGMINAGLKRFAEALEFFRQCVCIPASMPSAIAVEAYKKLVLVSLLVDGKAPTLPKCTPTLVSRTVKKAASKYEPLVTAFSTLDESAVAAAVASCTDALCADRNLGLAKQLIGAVMHAKVKRLTHVFASVSLADMAKHAGVPSAAAMQHVLLEMIECNTLAATINQATGMVTLHETPELFDSESSLARLHVTVRGVIALADLVRSLDFDLSSAPQFLRKFDQLGPASQGLGVSELATSMDADF